MAYPSWNLQRPPAAFLSIQLNQREECRNLFHTSTHHKQHLLTEIPRVCGCVYVCVCVWRSDSGDVCWLGRRSQGCYALMQMGTHWPVAMEQGGMLRHSNPRRRQVESK